MKLTVTVNGTEYEVDVEVHEPETPSMERISIGMTGGGGPVMAASAPGGDGKEGIGAPLAGTVFKILVEEGAEVSEGQVLIILEAMKMETEIVADTDGVVEAVHVAVAEAVKAGQALIKLIPKTS